MRPRSPTDAASPRQARTAPARVAPVPPVPGRGRRALEFGLRRMKATPLLTICGAVAFMGYGGLIALVLAGRLPLGKAGTVAILSLASWSFLLWWYPVLERTGQTLAGSPRRRLVTGVLEGFAIACIVLVHTFMVLIVVYAARS